MKIIKLNRDLRPWRAGQDAVVPDDVAAKLLASGDATDSRPYPPADVAPSTPVGGRPILKLKRPRSYFTRKQEA
jgi:hypothetical protein